MKDAVTELIDFGLWERELAVEKMEFACIARVAETMKNLRQITEAGL